VIILLDTNTFWPDRYAEKPWLSAVLNGAKQGDFTVVVPETVIRELVRQFPEELSEAIDESNEAIGAAAKKLRRLGLQPPSSVEVDEEALVAEYERKLRARLSGAGCRIENDPDDVGQLVNWAVNKRMPFKESGEGLPDAVIWLTALNLALEAEQVLLVSTNTNDFGDGASEPKLAPDLVADLEQNQLPADRVRLITNVKQLVDEIVAPMAEAEARALRLVIDFELANKVRNAIHESLLYESLPQDNLRLGVDLDNDPQVMGLDVETMEVSSVRQIGEGELFIRLRALCDLYLDTPVFKADWAIADDDSPVVPGGDLNDHYFEAEAEIAVWITLDIYSDPAAEEVEVASVEAADRLSDEEIVELRLARGAADALLNAIRDPSSGGEMSVASYSPDVVMQSGVDEATVEELHPSVVRVVSVDERSELGLCCSLMVECEGDVTWVVTAPSGFDSERWPSLSENPNEGGWMSDVEENVPLLLSLQATLTPSGEWIDLEPEELTLVEAEVERRAELSREAEVEEIELVEAARKRARQRQAEQVQPNEK
jgi:hypothetical protein